MHTHKSYKYQQSQQTFGYDDWKKRYDEAHKKFSEFVTHNYNQEECPEFRVMIDLVLEIRTKKSIDFHGLTKYQVDTCLDDLFQELSKEMEGTHKNRNYKLIVGKGLHSGQKGAQLPKKTLDACVKDYGIIIKDEKRAEVEAKGCVEIELTPAFSVTMTIIKEIKEDIKHLLKFSDSNEEQARFIIGFGKTGFKPIIADFCKDDFTQAKKANLLELLWEQIVNLMSSKFLEAKEKSFLLNTNPKLLTQLSNLYSKKPQSLKSYLEIAKTSINNLHVIYTFTSLDTSLNLKDLIPLGETFSEQLSPKSENVSKLLEEDKLYLFWRFDERTHTKNDPFTKITQLVKEEVDRSKPTNKKLFFIIHLIQNSKRETNVIGYDKNWSQCTIDGLIEEQSLIS